MLLGDGNQLLEVSHEPQGHVRSGLQRRQPGARLWPKVHVLHWKKLVCWQAEQKGSMLEHRVQVPDALKALGWQTHWPATATWRLFENT